MKQTTRTTITLNHLAIDTFSKVRCGKDVNLCHTVITGPTLDPLLSLPFLLYSPRGPIKPTVFSVGEPQSR